MEVERADAETRRSHARTDARFAQREGADLLDVPQPEQAGIASLPGATYVPFTDDETAEIARITRELVAAVAAARDALDRLPWASAPERDAAVSRIVAELPALVRTADSQVRVLPGLGYTPTDDEVRAGIERHAAERQLPKGGA